MYPLSQTPILLKELEPINKTVQESPYLTSEKKKDLEKEIFDVSKKILDGVVPFDQVEKIQNELNKKTAGEEISSLKSKIGLLNPESPRIKTLQTLAERLQKDDITAPQARQKIYEIMGGS